MTTQKNIISWLIRILLVCVFLAGVVVVFTPNLLNLEMVKKYIRERIAEDVGGQITYRNLKLSYFPRPHVSIQKAKISIPASFTIDVRWMRLYPKILPLLRGELKMAVVTLDYADYAMKLPQIKDSPNQQRQHIPSLDETIRAFIKGVQGLPEFKLPEGNLRIKNGRVNLIDPIGRMFKLRGLKAAYVDRDGMLDFSIKCKSNLWEQIDVSGSLDPSDFKGVGHFRLSRFRPQTLIAYLFPNSTFQVSDTRASVTVDVTSDGAGNIQADVSGAIPLLELIYKKEKLVIKESRIKGSLKVNEDRIQADLTELKLDAPKLNLTGSFVYHEAQQDINLYLEGAQIDANSVRKAALKLADASETIEILFDIIRGGYVPWMTVQLRGLSIADFGNLDNLTIRGRMHRGKIYIPGAELDLEEVFGDAEIVDGILHGKNLTARFGNSVGRDGTIALGLNDNLEPFHLNIGVRADLSQLPPVLRRVVPDKGFQAELGRLRDVEGVADGILILGDNLSDMRARVEVSNAQLTARYDRIPYPIRLQGGRFVLDDSWIKIQDLNADVGQSVLTQLSMTIDWAQKPGFEAAVGTANLDLAQLYTGLSSIRAVKTHLNGIRSLSGSVAIQNGTIAGPLFRPQQWDFQSSGKIDNVVLSTRQLPKDLVINRGQFIWQTSRIQFSSVDAAMGTSSLTDLSGSVDVKKKGAIKARANAAIFDAADVSPLFLTDTDLIRTLKPILPLRGKLNFNKLTFSGAIAGASSRPTEFSAVVRKIALNSGGLPGPLQIDQGQLKWGQNRFVISDMDARIGKSQISQFSATFDQSRQKSFHLDCKSASLYAGEIYPLLASFEDLQPEIGSIATSEGILALSNVAIKGPLGTPTKWHWSLIAASKGVVVNAEALKDPLKISSAALIVSTRQSNQSVRKRIDIETVEAIWGDNHLTLTGKIELSAGEVLTDLNVDADSMDWDQINALLQNLTKKENQVVRRKGSDKLLGTIKVKSTSFAWDSYTVRPLKADITFHPDKVTVAVNEADVCGISFKGLLNVKDRALDLYFMPTAVSAELVSTLSCLTAKKELATGTYNLNGEVLAKARPEAIARSLTGKLAFSADKGRIYRFGLLAKLLSILNVTEIYRGEIPDLTGEGFAYHSMTASAKLQGGKIIMEECAIDGVSMGIACEGDIDLVEKKIDLLILVAPFKTVDRIVDILPLIGKILGGKLISIPFKAKGDLNDPNVYPLPPTAVGSGILGILERTLKLPITIIQPVISGLKGGKPNVSRAPENSPH